MKKLIIYLFALLLALMPLSGMAAAVRYPELTGVVTDAANALSETTIANIAKLQSQLEDEDADLRLNIAVVDFLDGQTEQAYADELFRRAKLGEDDILLLLCVGEDRYAVSVGKDVKKDFSAAYLQSELISTGFAVQLRSQQYDLALTNFFSSFIPEIEKKLNIKLSAQSLFGHETQTVQLPQSQSQGSSYAQMLSDLISGITQNAKEYEAKPVEHVASEGLTPAGWVILVILIMLVFSQSDPARKMKRNGCSGCGCAPLSSLISAMGLASLFGALSKKGRRG